MFMRRCSYFVLLRGWATDRLGTVAAIHGPPLVLLYVKQNGKGFYPFPSFSYFVFRLLPVDASQCTTDLDKSETSHNIIFRLAILARAGRAGLLQLVCLLLFHGIPFSC